MSVAPSVDIGTHMSNFDHSIDEGFEARLRAEPNAVFGRHAGWNFNARVWFDGAAFQSEVWRYGSPVEVVSAPDLRQLMRAVNDRYGDE